MAWLAGYTFRKKCTVVATIGGAQTDYQMKLLVGESPGAAGEDTDCENHCQAFPNDIRFTAADGETKHDYWVESVTGTTPNRLATVVIEVAFVPASGSVDFYIYYGKSGDSGESSGANTFIFFAGNPTGLNFTETQALNVARKAWQGVASDGTNLYSFTNCESGTNDVQKIYKFNKSGAQLDVNSAAGTAHMSAGCYHNSKLYVTDMKNWYSGQPHSEAIGNIRLYNITSGLPYANENHDVGNHWAEAVCFYDSHFWIVYHCCSIIRKYDSSWNFVKEYDIDGHGGTEESWADGNGYQGIDFFQDSGKTYIGLTVHTTVTGGPKFYYFEYDSVADSFTIVDHFDPPNTAANQGWQCDAPLDISDVWFADRQGPPGYIRQNAGSFAERTTGDWDEFTDRTGGSLAITDTPQKRSSSKAFQYTQNSASVHGLWRDKFGQQQTGKFWLEFDVQFAANNKKHLITTSEEMLTWTSAKKGTYVVINRDVGHQGWISVYESAYNDIQAFTINQWYKFGELIDIAADTWDLWIDGVVKDTNLTFGYGNALSNIEQINVGGYSEYPNGYYYIQDVRIRKHASPEPTWGAWGGEEGQIVSAETGAGADAIAESLATRIEAETGAGAEVIAESLATRIEAETGAGVDALISLLIAKFGSDTGSGMDAVSELLAALTQSDQGVGLEAIGSRLLGSSDVGVGTDAWSSLLAAIENSDIGVGADAWSSLLAAIEDSDSGAGVEASTVSIIIYLLLKLLQKKGLNIDLSQKGRGLNLKLTQEGSPK